MTLRDPQTEPTQRGGLWARLGAWMLLGLVMTGVGLALYAVVFVVDVVLPSIAGQIGDATPGMGREFLLWLSTNEVIAAINKLAGEWGGLLTILGLLLTILGLWLSGGRSKS